MDVIETFKFSKNGIDFSVNVVCFNEFSLFNDLYTMTDDHQGGVTIKNPNHHRGGYKYAIPEFTLAERIKTLTEQGDPNPSANAYSNAVKSLERDLDASDYGFQVTAEINGVTLLDGETLGCSFDYSYHDEGSLIDAARDCFTENGIDGEAVAAAKSAAGAIVEQMETLKKIA